MKPKEEVTIQKDPNLIKKVEEICEKSVPFNHIKALNYPRLAGTEGEKKAADYLETKFKEYGYEPKVEEFYLPEASLMGRLISPLFIVVWGIFSYLNVLYITGITEYIFALLILLVPIGVLIGISKLEIFFRRMLNQKYKKIQKITKQIKEGTYKKSIKREKIIYVETDPNEFEEHLYLTAHYDSTTLKLNMKILKLFGLFSFLGAVGYLLSYLLHYFLQLISGFNLFGGNPLVFLILLVLFIVPITIILLGRIFRTNESHGAIDNLTGTALVLELAMIAKKINPKLNITFILFPAEEAGLIGSAYHYNVNKDSFRNKNLRVVSIDMIGEIPPLMLIEKIKPFLSLPMEPEFNETMITLAQRLGIDIKLGKFLYPGSDFANWFLNGYQSNWVMTPSKYLHSTQDIPENVNQTLLNECLKLFTAYLLERS